MPLLNTERGLDRLVNFTDAAVAISLTLLILPLVDVGADVAHAPLGQVISDHWHNILAFIISFAVISNLWLLHHRLFELVSDYDGGLARLNLFWLAMVSVLPFTTNMVANASSSGAVYGVYIGNIFLATVAMVLTRVYLSKHPKLLREDAAGELQIAASIVPTVLLLVALVLAVLVPQVGALWLLILFAGSPLQRLVTRRGSRAA